MKQKLTAIILNLLLVLFCGCARQEEAVHVAALPDAVQSTPAPDKDAPTIQAETTQKDEADVIFHLQYATQPLPDGIRLATAMTAAQGRTIVGGLGEEGPALAWTTLDGETGNLELPPDGTEYIYAACPANDGGFFVLMGSLPALYRDAAGAVQSNETPDGSLFLARYDENHNLQAGFRLKNAYAGINERFFQLLYADGGAFYLMSDSLLVRVNAQGEETARLEIDFKSLGWRPAAIQMAAEKLFVLAVALVSGASDELWQLDPGTLEQLDTTILADGNVYGMGLLEDGRLVLNGSQTLSAYDPATGEKQALLYLSELGIQLPARQVQPLSGGYAFFDPGAEELTLLLWQPGEQAGRTLLQMAVLGEGSWEITQMVRAFNLSQTHYQVDVTAYSETPGENGGTYDALRTQIIAGDAPDLFCFCSDSLAAAVPIAAEDTCIDLLPLLDAGGALTRGSILPNLLKTMAAGGGLYELPLSFTIDTFVAPSRLISGPGVTVAELEQALESAGSGWVPVESWNEPGNLLALSVPFYMGQAIDRQNGTCDFQTQEFCDYLAWCRAWGGDGSTPPAPERAILRYQQIRSLEKLAGIGERAEQYWFGEPGYTYAGVPNETNSGSTFCITRSLGISPRCRDMDGAWAFLQFCFTYAGTLTDNLPAGGEALHTLMDAYIAGEMTDWLGEPTVIAQDDADQFYALLDSITVRKGADEALKNIILDEAAPYFDGQCTAEQAAENIQSRASVYLMEQYG